VEHGEEETPEDVEGGGGSAFEKALLAVATLIAVAIFLAIFLPPVVSLFSTQGYSPYPQEERPPAKQVSSLEGRLVAPPSGGGCSYSFQGATARAVCSRVYEISAVYYVDGSVYRPRWVLEAPARLVHELDASARVYRVQVVVDLRKWGLGEVVVEREEYPVVFHGLDEVPQADIEWGGVYHPPEVVVWDPSEGYTREVLFVRAKILSCSGDTCQVGLEPLEEWKTRIYIDALNRFYCGPISYALGIKCVFYPAEPAIYRDALARARVTVGNYGELFNLNELFSFTENKSGGYTELGRLLVERRAIMAVEIPWKMLTYSNIEGLYSYPAIVFAANYTSTLLHEFGHHLGMGHGVDPQRDMGEECLVSYPLGKGDPALMPYDTGYAYEDLMNVASQSVGLPSTRLMKTFSGFGFAHVLRGFYELWVHGSKDPPGGLVERFSELGVGPRGVYIPYIVVGGKEYVAPLYCALSARGVSSMWVEGSPLEVKTLPHPVEFVEMLKTIARAVGSPS